MTREETVEYAIKFFNRRLREPVLQYGERQAIHIAISALREQEERSKGCMYCDIAKANEGVINKALWVKESETYKWTLCGMRMTFCPMCGRRLEEV